MKEGDTEKGEIMIGKYNPMEINKKDIEQIEAIKYYEVKMDKKRATY